MPRYEWDLSTLFHGNNNVFELSTVLKLGIEIIQAIQSIHEFGITHRDLKPSNIMFQMDEQEECHIKLIDFGLSKQFQTTDGTHISFQTGNILSFTFYLHLCNGLLWDVLFCALLSA